MSTSEVILPASIRRVVRLGVEAVDPVRVILFGSRARGDARDDSDYDLAFVFSPHRQGDWLRFLAELTDAPVTLLPADLVEWNAAAEALRERIRSEGVVIYERSDRA